MKIKFIKSSYDVIQHGTFESFDVVDDDQNVLFYWSDNNGFVSHISDVAKYGKKVQDVFNEMCKADVTANAMWVKENDTKDGESSVIVYSREGRTNEFGVEWETL